MKKYVLLILLTGMAFAAKSQNLSGQWKGHFVEKSQSINGWGGDRCEYVLDLECNGNNVSGFSYTYFTEGGKRYYTICKLEGFIDKKKKYIEVKETERTKTNVPIEVRNCFQVHKLFYSRIENNEILEGDWFPAPQQDVSCGKGITSLTRRALRASFPRFNNTAAKAVPSKTPAKKKVVADPKTKPSLTAKVPVKKPASSTERNTLLTPNKDSFVKPELPVKTVVPKIFSPSSSFEKRNSSIIKTIEVDQETVKVDLYDNGEIDGDSISLFYNNKLVFSRKRLSEKAISLNITVDDDQEVNELVMYAENLGSIPPNTALMVVTDGAKRYEVRITSDLQKNGTIRFVHRPAKKLKLATELKP